MRTTWEKVVQHIGIAIIQDISTEFLTITLMVIPETTQIQEILDIKMRKFQLRNTTHVRPREVRNKVLESLVADATINNMDDVLNTADIQN